MDISPNELRRQTLATMREIDAQIQVVINQAADREVNMYTIRDQNGSLIMPPLLQAKALCLNTLALLRGK